MYRITDSCLRKNISVVLLFASCLIPWASGSFAQTTSAQSGWIILKNPSSPELRIVEPLLTSRNECTVGTSRLAVKGTAKHTSGVKRVQVNGIDIAVAPNGDFSTELSLVEGRNTITLNARGNTGETAELTFTALCDMKPPVVEIVEPKIRDVRGIVNIDQEMITIRGSVIDESGIKDITLNGRNVEMDSRTSFWKELNLAEGENEVVIAAEDSAGNATEKRVRIRHSRPVPTTEFLKGRSYALIIGIDNYRGEWQPLKNAVRDAKAVEALLRNQFRFDRLYTLYNEEAKREKIITTFEMLAKNVRPEDNLLIYYSGHGEYERIFNKGYWVPADAQQHSTAQYISNSEIQTYMGGIPARHVLLVADACFAGDIFKGPADAIPYENTSAYYKKVYSRKSRKALTSGGVEPVLDGGRDGHSVFNYYFLKALEEQEGQYFDAWQVFDKLRIPVANNSEQTPEFLAIKNTGDEGGQFVFVRK
jgi:hypothetical protein